MLTRSIFLCLCLLLVGCAPAAITSFGFAVDITNAPPPPRIVFESQPRLVAVSSSVYVVEESDYDMFQCGGYWYLESDGYWYRAASYNGPYAVVEVRSVPRAVLETPQERWKHPPHGRHWDRGRGPGA